MASSPDPERTIYTVWGGAERAFGLGNCAGPEAWLKLHEALRSGPMAERWAPVHYYLAPKDDPATRSWNAPDAWIEHAGILVRADRADELIAPIDDLVERLPIEVEGVPWTFAHYIAHRAVLDEKRSDWIPPPLPHPHQRYWMIRRAVLHDDPRLYRAFFTIEGTGEALRYCGAGFRERVLGMGLVGLAFREVGYFHREGDPEPPPPEPWFPLPDPSDLPPSPWAPIAPGADLLRDIERAGTAMHAELGLAASATDEQLLDALTQRLAGLRPRWSKLGGGERQRQLLGLAAVYGDLFVQRLGWQWRELTSAGGRMLAVTSADDSHFIAVPAYVETLIRRKRREITLALHFNMAQAKVLPPSLPGALVELR